MNGVTVEDAFMHMTSIVSPIEVERVVAELFGSGAEPPMGGLEKGSWINQVVRSGLPASGLFLDVEFGEYSFHRFQQGVVEFPGRKVIVVLDKPQFDDSRSRLPQRGERSAHNIGWQRGRGDLGAD